MAITRKQKEPSAGTNESRNNHHMEGSSSKKIATKKYNVQSSEPTPLPKCSPVPVITMIIHFREQEQSSRVLLNTGSTVSFLSAQFTLEQSVPVAERYTKRMMQENARQDVNGAGALFTAPLLLQHGQDFSLVLFEVTLPATDYNAILPHWLLAKHQCDLLATNGCSKFTLAEWK